MCNNFEHSIIFRFTVAKPHRWILSRVSWRKCWNAEMPKCKFVKVSTWQFSNMQICRNIKMWIFQNVTISISSQNTNPPGPMEPLQKDARQSFIPIGQHGAPVMPIRNLKSWRSLFGQAVPCVCLDGVYLIIFIWSILQLTRTADR